MRKQFYKIISIFTMLLMIFGTLIPTYSPVFAETQPLADGEYTIDFQVLKEGSEEISVMNGYTERPAILKVENGNKYVELTLKNSNWIKKFQVEKAGVYLDAEVISKDEGKDTRVVRFEVESLSEKLNAFTHVIVTGIPGFNYDNEYTIQLKFDLGSLVEVNVPTPEPEEPTEPEKPEATYEDGEYTINFRALHATKEDTDSSMKDWILNPAKLVVEDGKNYVYLTVQEKPGQYLTDIRLEKNGEFVSQEIVSKKEELLQRVIKFEVPELGIVNAEVDMHVVAANYKNTQKFRMSFDVNSMEPIEKMPTPEPEEPTEPEKPEPTYEDGEYTINFRALHATKEDTDSSMKDWILNPAKLVVEDGKNYVYLTVQEKPGQYLTDIRLEKNGEFVSQEIVSKKEELLQRVIKFEVPELGIVNAEVDMHVVAANYKNTQKFRMSFDVNSMEPIEKPTYEDGEYTINFRALHATKEDTDSSMKDWILNPAKLVVEDGKNYVYLTVQEKSGQYLTDIRLEKNGEFVSQEIVSKKEELLQRVIKFEVPELGIVNAEVDMHVVAANYKNTQKFRMSFEAESIQKVITSHLDTNGSVSLENITMPTSIQTNYNDQPISIVVPAGSNSLTVSELKSDANSLLVKISVGNLGNKTVKLTLRKPAGLDAAQVGAYHQNGDAWEYREAQVVGDNVVFETNLSAVKIAEAIMVPILSEPTVSENKVTLEWNKVSGATYELRINKDKIVSMEENNSYIATVGYNQPNLYEVRAIKDKHQSAWSNSVTATTGKEPSSEQGPGGTPQTPGGTNDEIYTIDFKVLKEGTNNKSVMDDYTWKPAELKVKDGRNYISLTLLNSSWIKSFQTEKGDAKVVSTNDKANTRVVQFEVPDLSKKLSATTHVVIPSDEFPGSGSYDERYTVQIQFDPSSKTVLKGSIPTPTTPNTPVTPVTPVAEKAIKAKDGGKIEESGVLIQFPADSFASDFKVTVKKVASPSSLPLAENESFVSDVLEITKDKTGDFKKAITLTLNFDNTKVNTTKHEVGLFWLNETTKKWVKLDNVKVDLKNGKVSGEVNHFTKFAVLAIDQTEQNNQPTQPETPSDFTDIKGHWAEEHIVSLAKIGAITGYPTGEFKPNNNITRAEFATVIVKAFGLDVIKGDAFDDTKNHWASDYIATAEAKGIVSGYSKTKFGPNDVITREQMALMVVRVAELQSNDSTLSFKDANQISAWAQSAVKTAVHEKIITGYPNNMFKPKGNATRAEAVVVIVKALNK